MKRGQHIYKKAWEKSRGEKIPKGWHIHHLDGNNQNHHPDNLLACTREEHRQIHEALYGRYGRPRDYFAAQRLGGSNFKHPGHTEDAKRRISEARKKAGANMGVKVECLKTGRVFDSILDYCRHYNFQPGKVWYHLNKAKKNKFQAKLYENGKNK